MDNSMLIMNAILFILIIYLQLQINKLSNNNQENFDAASDNIASINNLGKLAGDILNTTTGTLKIPVTTNINGGLSLNGGIIAAGHSSLNDVYVVGGTDAPLIVGAKKNTGDILDTTSTYSNQWLFSTPTTGDSLGSLFISPSNRNDPANAAKGQYWPRCLQLTKEGSLIVSGDFQVYGKILRANGSVI